MEKRLEKRRLEREAQAVLDEIKRLEDEKLAAERAEIELLEENQRREEAEENRRLRAMEEAARKLAKKEGKSRLKIVGRRLSTI